MELVTLSFIATAILLDLSSVIFLKAKCWLNSVYELNMEFVEEKWIVYWEK